MLEDWLLLWRDVARAASPGTQLEGLVNADRREWIIQLAGTLSMPQIVALLRATSQTLQHLDRNANARLALDVLLLKLPRLPSS